jgi:hypothetical protein
MELVKQPLLVRLTSEILLGIIGIPAWGVGFIPQSAWARLEKDENLVKQFKAFESCMGRSELDIGVQ